ncbi:gamma subclass chorismate mutase AroQ [Aeromonas salmonicida]|uniref:gamma subclass chorismate mutase AroQ n=1 Tax=Aeromonas salmonicida TaxID=645 RepID=UPI003D1FDB8E
MELKCMTSSPASLGVILKQRFLLMDYIASYKMKHHLPVEDISQEQLVMEQIMNHAEKIGLVPSSLVPFVDAQIRVAKAIQYRCKAKWLIFPDYSVECEEIFIVRNEVRRLDQELLKLLKNEIYYHGRLLKSSIADVVTELAFVAVSQEEIELLKRTLINISNNKMIVPIE